MLFIRDHGFDLLDRVDRFGFGEGGGREVGLGVAQVAKGFLGLQEEESFVEVDSTVVLFFQDAPEVGGTVYCGFHDLVACSLHEK